MIARFLFEGQLGIFGFDYKCSKFLLRKNLVGPLDSNHDKKKASSEKNT